ncbi:RNA-binding protein [Metabacillus iocasae]|uniref:RNA-binding protein YlmH n=1 Tax=Priestia iocasae TaxID=2291674 RepID=A0ABS2QQQ8_9BACI|nr:RNA-binding protein [Metabacillus iocasae]MBM7701789.1 RNA-binding protein YlmH [Metabacillus iocasae]
MSIYQHFRPEEHTFIDHVLEWKEEVTHQYSPKLTDFLDPREQQIASAIIGTDHDVKIAFYGGLPSSERKRALIFPDYYVHEEKDFQIALFEVDYPKKFVTIEHPQILGSLMSLGLIRSKFGDIIVENEQVQIIVASETASYVQANLQSIGKAKVQLKSIMKEQLIEVHEEMIEQAYTVSSMRLDVILSNVYNVSRQKIQAMIEHNLVKVNWKTIEQPSFECKVDDMLSLRGHGRSKIVSIDGKTKKDKWRIVVGKQK